MPNWKKIALSGSSPEFTSLNVDNSISAGSLTGSIDFNNLTNSPTLLSSSAQIASDISGSFTSTSASIASDIASLVSDSGSFSTRVTAIEGFSSSIESSIYSYTGSFTGDGSGLTGVQTEVTEIVTKSDTFTNATTHSVSHLFRTKDVNVTLYDENDDIFIPARINTPTTSSVVVYMEPAITGRVVISKGGHIVSASRDIVETATVSDTFTLATTHSVSHAFGTKDVFVTLYDDNDEQFIPSKIITPTTSSVIVHMDPASTGRVVVAKGGHLVSGSQQFDVDFSSVEEHIIPATADTYDLGSVAKPWRDLYLSEASLYIDGQQVISSTSDTLTFTTDTGQSIKLLETGADDIILQTDTGNIELKGTVEILSGKKITDSAGTVIQFGDTIGVTGSIETTGTVDGIDLQAFSGSVATSIANSTADYTELTNVPAGIISGAAQLPSDIVSSSTQTLANLAGSGIVSGALSYYTDADTLTYINSLGVVSGSITHYTDSDTLTYINSLGVVSGSVASDWDSVSSKPAGIVSSSAQITALTSYTETFTSQTAVTASHSLGTKNVTVSVYGSDDYMIFPTSIKTHDDNNVYVQFNSSRTGRIVITK